MPGLRTPSSAGRAVRVPTGSPAASATVVLDWRSRDRSARLEMGGERETGPWDLAAQGSRSSLARSRHDSASEMVAAERRERLCRGRIADRPRIAVLAPRFTRFRRCRRLTGPNTGPGGYSPAVAGGAAAVPEALEAAATAGSDSSRRSPRDSAPERLWQAVRRTCPVLRPLQAPRPREHGSNRRRRRNV